MENDKNLRNAPDVQRRLDAFVDCLARLMARRWLREQQDEADLGPEIPEAGSYTNKRAEQEPRRTDTERDGHCEERERPKYS